MSAAVATCRVCGCTDLDCRGCIERTGEPCSWVPELATSAGPICSACAPTAARLSDAAWLDHMRERLEASNRALADVMKRLDAIDAEIRRALRMPK